VKRYRFPLETSRRVHRIREDMAASALAQARHELDLARADADARSQRYAELRRALDGTDAASLVEAVARLRLEADAVVVARRAVRDASARVDAAIDEWTRCRAEVAALDTLDDRLREQHRLEWSREEQAELDDIASIRASLEVST
jgi:flagellar export protein FliJ